MPHIVRDIGWGTIDIVEHQSRVFFQQRWKYSWQETPPLKPWSLAEKRAFHADVDRQVWASWSNRVQLSVSGTSAFARRFSRTCAPMARGCPTRLHRTVRVCPAATQHFS